MARTEVKQRLNKHLEQWVLNLNEWMTSDRKWTAVVDGNQNSARRKQMLKS